MTVKELITLLQNCPEDENVSVIYPEDSLGEDNGVRIDSVACVIGTKNVKNGVYIRLG